VNIHQTTIHLADGRKWEGISNMTDLANLRDRCVAKMREDFGNEVAIEKIVINGEEVALP
jgi:hypothetical protein